MFWYYSIFMANKPYSVELLVLFAITLFIASLIVHFIYHVDIWQTINKAVIIAVIVVAVIGAIFGPKLKN